MKIAIDAGHGKDGDPGAVGPYGTREADVTLELAVQTGNLLLALGHLVVICDRSLYSSERAVEATKQGCDLLVSLHTNAGSSQARGIEAWFCHGNVNGQKLASSILRLLTVETGEPSRGVKDDQDWKPAKDPTWTGGMGILRNFPGPGALLELCFISNPVEEKLLASPEFIQKCAHAIALGIQDFINSWKKEVKAMGNPGPNLDPFPDLPADRWQGRAREMVLTLQKYGIVSGYEDGTFRPDQPITRLEAVALIYKTLASLEIVPKLE